MELASLIILGVLNTLGILYLVCSQMLTKDVVDDVVEDSKDLKEDAQEQYKALYQSVGKLEHIINNVESRVTDIGREIDTLKGFEEMKSEKKKGKGK